MMVSQDPKETGVYLASKEMQESQERGVLMVTQVCQESVVCLDPKGSRVCRARGEPLARWVAMETLDHLVHRVLLALQGPRDPLA